MIYSLILLLNHSQIGKYGKGIIVLLAFIFFATIRYIVRRYKSKIKNTKSFDETIEIRKRLSKRLQNIVVGIKIFQWFWYVLLFASLISIAIMYIFETDEMYSLNRWIISVSIIITFCVWIIYILPKQLKKWRSNNNELTLEFYFKKTFYFSFFTKEQYLKQNDRFALYLRGFDDDIYENKFFLNMWKNQFIENDFITHLKPYIETIGVGSPQEANCPKGAVRVYLDNNTWQKDVHELMEKAEDIYILLHDSPACLWEINQSLDLLNKTTFIITSNQIYKKIIEQCNIDFLFTDINLNRRGIAFISFSNNEVKIHKMENNSNNYKEFIKKKYHNK